MSRFNGQTNHMPGAYRVAYPSTGVTIPAYTEFDIRGGTAAISVAAADLLSAAEVTAMEARGEIKQINIYCSSGVVDIADAAVPGGGYRVDATNGPAGVTLNYSNRMGRSSYWIRTVGGAATFQTEIYLDIPPEEYV